MSRAALAMILLVAVASPASAGELSGYEALADWNALSRAKAVVSGLASSYDRSGANSDFNQYEFPDGLQSGDVDAVIATLAGPGVITRFWMPHAAADEAFPVKITIDEGLPSQYVIDTNSDALLDATSPYAAAPLVSTLVGGQVSYETICFEHSLRIESCNYSSGVWARRHHYYQYGYQLLGPGNTVRSYDGSLTPAQQADRVAAVAIVEGAGANPAGSDPNAAIVSSAAQSIDPGGTLTLASLTGPGRIRRLNLKINGASDAKLDGLRLRIAYDGQAGYAVDVPVSQFFGAGHQREEYQSVPLGTDGADGFYCYWPMPFRRGVTVELHNATGSAIAIDSAVVEHAAGGVSDTDGYLHAAFSEETLAGGGDGPYHTLLAANGAGHYVGNLLYLQRAGTDRGILEGDDIVIVNGGQYLYGTGMEDAYNGGYYYNHVVVQDDDGDAPSPESGIGAFHGLLHMDDADFGDDFVRTDQYRWLIADAVAFTDGIEVLIEHYHNANDALFGSTAFYYLIPDAPAPADANFDGTVNVGDLALLAGHWQDSGAAWSEGDFNGDGVVNVGDLAMLAANWEGAAPAPEPAGTLLLAAGAIGLLSRRRKVIAGSD